MSKKKHNKVKEDMQEAQTEQEMPDVKETVESVATEDQDTTKDEAIPIEELEAQDYHITSIAGCSMGALIGGVYAAGKLEEFRDWMKTVDKKKIFELTDFSLSLNHIVKGTRIIEAIMEFVPDVPIEDLPIPYCAVATDWKSGHEVVFRKGSLFQAIRASISLGRGDVTVISSPVKSFKKRASAEWSAALFISVSIRPP